MTVDDVPMEGLEPPHLAASDPKSDVSTNFTTWAFKGCKNNGFDGKKTSINIDAMLFLPILVILHTILILPTAFF